MMSSNRIVFLSVILLAGCQRSGNYGGFPDARKIDINPSKVLVLEQEDGRQIQTDASACAVDILVVDSSLVFSRYEGEQLIASINKETFEPNGAFLKKGRGPGEVSDLVPLFGNYTRWVNDRFVLSYLDVRNDWLGLDLPRSLARGRAMIMEVSEVPQDFKTLGGHLIHLGNGRFWGRILEDNMTRYERSLQGGGKEKEITPAMEQLNTAHIETERSAYAFNLVGTIPGYNPELGRIVEASTRLNTIHLYDLEGAFARTYYVGKRPDDITEKEQELLHASRGVDQLQTTCLQVYKEFFAVLRHDGYLLIMDWDGRLLQALQIENIPAMMFDFDFETGRLFTLDNETEAVWCFDLSSYGPLFTSGHRF